MFNSIRKDDNCRKLVKSFEILRLQNKTIVQAMSKSDVFGLDVAFFDNTDVNLNAEKKPSLLSSNLTLQNKRFSTTKGFCFDTQKTFPEKQIETPVKTSDRAKGKIINKNRMRSAIAVKAFHNYNCFTDLELCKSSLHLFAKKKAKENKITKSPKSENNNKSLLPSPKAKWNVSYKAFSPSLLSLAKGRIISLPRNSSKSRIKNRCIETGRSHSVLRFCKLSRICLRDNASKALVSGISKASW